MLPVAALAPPAVLAIMGALAWLPPVRLVRIYSRLPGLGAWVASGLLVWAWLPARTVRELTYASPGAGVQLGLRLDAVTVAFGLLTTVPIALLLTLRSVRRGDAGFAALAAAGSLFAMEANNLLLAGFAWSATATLLLLSPRYESSATSVRFWATLTAATLLLLMAAALIYVAGGTTVYAATPVAALGSAAFLLIAAAGLWLSAALPVRTWLHFVWVEAGPVTATVFACILVPTGFYLLTRCYEIGSGHWPRQLMNDLLIGCGAATAAAAAYRAQRAATVPEYALEVVPPTAGFALVALAAATPVGVTAAIGALASFVVVLPLLPTMTGGLSALSLAALTVVAGLPPGVVFGTRLIAMQAAVDSGAIGALAAILLALSYLVLLAAGARAARLPAVRHREMPATFSSGALLILLAIVSGGLLGWVLNQWGVPAAASVLRVDGPVLSGGSYAVLTDSGAWPALAVAVSGAALVVLLAISARGGWPGLRRRGEVSPAFWELRTPPAWAALRARFALQTTSDPRQQLHLPEALARTPLRLTAIIFLFLVFVAQRWSS